MGTSPWSLSSSPLPWSHTINRLHDPVSRVAVPTWATQVSSSCHAPPPGLPLSGAGVQSSLPSHPRPHSPAHPAHPRAQLSWALHGSSLPLPRGLLSKWRWPQSPAEAFATRAVQRAGLVHRPSASEHQYCGLSDVHTHTRLSTVSSHPPRRPPAQPPLCLWGDCSARLSATCPRGQRPAGHCRASRIPQRSVLRSTRSALSVS